MLHQIGAGTLGPVFRAYQPDLDRLAAVKLFRLDVLPERLHVFLGELERLIAAELEHPAIARPLGAGIAGSAVYLAQDFVAADSLDTLVREFGAAPAVDAVRVATQLAGALDYAAVAGVQHGALHPRDVLVSPDDTRITGLGIAAALERVGLAPPIRRPYAAPERVAQQRWDRRADVFGLAALIYELLGGWRMPATPQQALESLDDIAQADPGVLRQVFARALAEHPVDRYATALEFAEALRTAFPAIRGDEVVERVSPDVVPAGLPMNSAAATSEVDRSTATESRLPLESGELPLAASLLETVPELALEQAPETTLPQAPEPAFEKAPGLTVQRPLEAALEKVPEVTRGKSPEAILEKAPEPTPDNRIADLDLRVAEEERVEQAEAAPSLVQPSIDIPLRSETRASLEPEAAADEAVAAAISEFEPPISNTASQPDSQRIAAGASALERSRSTIWPLLVAVSIGVAVGFAGGYGVASRDRPPLPQPVTTVPTVPEASRAQSAPAATAGNTPREFTETSIPIQQPRGPDLAVSPVPAPTSPPAEAGRHGALPGIASRESTTDSGTRRSRSAAPEARRSPSTVAPASAGRLLVRSTPAGARVRLDGKDVGETPVTLRDLTRGAHQLHVTRDGYLPEDRRITIRSSNPAQSIMVELARASAAGLPRPETPASIGRYTGGLAIESRPAGASVYVDGKLAGTTPLSLGDLKAGEHAIRLERDGYRRWTASVRVVGGEQNRVTASLER